MIEIKVENGGVSTRISGNGLEILTESCVIAKKLEESLSECHGGFALSAMFRESLKDDKFWEINPFVEEDDEKPGEENTDA